MTIKALVNFSGIISMSKGEIRNVENDEVLNDLISAGYVKEVNANKKGVKSDGSK